MTGTFTIDAGSHFCRPRFPFLLWSKEMVRIVRFDTTCLYPATGTETEENLNKVFGFGEPSFLKVMAQAVKDLLTSGKVAGEWHHEASARIGWNCNAKGELWLHGYSYATGKREMMPVCAVPVNTDILCSIRISSDHYVFDVTIKGYAAGYNQETVTIVTNRSAKGKRAFGFGLFFYFGGGHSAPHQMQVSLRRP
jgi:hypothetical protein